LSRDPIEEQGGVNLYGFVDNGGPSFWDRLGLKKPTYEKALEILMSYKPVDYSESATAIYAKVQGWLYGKHLDEIVRNLPEKDRRYRHSCALRLSIALSNAGYDLRGVKGTSSIIPTGKFKKFKVGEEPIEITKGDVSVLGSGKSHVIISAPVMQKYLEKTFGKPDYPNKAAYLQKKEDRDIVIFASNGHVGVATGKNQTLGNGLEGKIWVFKKDGCDPNESYDRVPDEEFDVDPSWFEESSGGAASNSPSQ